MIFSISLALLRMEVVVVFIIETYREITKLYAGQKI